VIPDLTAIAERFGVSPALAPLVLAALLTSLVLFVQSIARWLEDRKP
jgi:hypothetical protein